MLFKRTYVLRLFASFAAVALIGISVHGIFLHTDKSDVHACSLCELPAYEQILPELPQWKAKLVPPVQITPQPQITILYRTVDHSKLRGPPSIV